VLAHAPHAFGADQKSPGRETAFNDEIGF
jgi:hypothetical protein